MIKTVNAFCQSTSKYYVGVPNKIITSNWIFSWKTIRNSNYSRYNFICNTL